MTTRNTTLRRRECRFIFKPFMTVGGWSHCENKKQRGAPDDGTPERFTGRPLAGRGGGDQS